VTDEEAAVIDAAYALVKHFFANSDAGIPASEVLADMYALRGTIARLDQKRAAVTVPAAAPQSEAVYG
jgi:hypothetical protein